MFFAIFPVYLSETKRMQGASQDFNGQKCW
jgi:hypothetical protein